MTGTAQHRYDVYAESAAWNRWLGYVEHIHPLTVANLGDEGLARLDTYFAHVVNAEAAQPILLSQMVADYIKRYPRTEPVAVVEPPNSDSALKLFYYDAGCEFSFVEGRMDPVEIKNYTGEQTRQLQANRPVLVGFSPVRHRTQLHIEIVVESNRAMPYGIAVWGDHEGLKLTESNADAVHWIGHHSLFIRLTLHAGKNEFHVKLTI